MNLATPNSRRVLMIGPLSWALPLQRTDLFEIGHDDRSLQAELSRGTPGESEVVCALIKLYTEQINVALKGADWRG